MAGRGSDHGLAPSASFRDTPRGQRTTFGTGADGTRVDRLAIGSDPTGPTPVTCGVLTRGAALHGVWLNGGGLNGGGLSISPGGQGLAAQAGPLASFGALMGPVVNRVRDGRVRIDGQDWQMPCVPGGGWSQHSGPDGLHTRNWLVDAHGPDHVRLRLDLAHGDCGLPGTRTFKVEYRATPGAITCTLRVTTDRTTPINIAHHAYWNLAGGGPLTGHRLEIPASRMLETDAQILPTGRLLGVEGTALDYRELRALAPDTGNRHDHCLILDAAPEAPPDPLRPAARLVGPDGTTMRLWTDAPALQVYDGGTVDSAGLPGLNGPQIRPFEALALEAQGYPDAPNQPEFPSILLRPGQTHQRVTRWEFSLPG